VAGNLIGTDVTGAAAIANGTWGVAVVRGAKFNRIGTDGDGVGDDAERNVVSGNTLAGVLIADSGTEQNVVAGNYIGTTADGSAALGNGWEGVRLQNGASQNVIGFNPTDADPVDDRNIISANGLGGVGIYNLGTDLNLVAGNFIGTDATGTGNLGNAGCGVIIQGGPRFNTIGGTIPGECNVIAHNFDCGVLVDAATNNPIRGNSIFDHPNGMGICLRNGGNNNQAPPILTSAVVTDSGVIVQGIISGAANAQFALDFFANSVCHPSGYGEGERFLGWVTVPTDGTGVGNFTVTLDGDVSVGEFITATATDPIGNTSQFSKCMPVDSALPDAGGRGVGVQLAVAESGAQSPALSSDPAPNPSNKPILPANSREIMDQCFMSSPWKRRTMSMSAADSVGRVGMTGMGNEGVETDATGLDEIFSSQDL
jgi:hypothetical protein